MLTIPRITFQLILRLKIEWQLGSFQIAIPTGVGGSWLEFIVRNLSQFISVDIYGGCATEAAKKCPINRPVCITRCSINIIVSIFVSRILCVVLITLRRNVIDLWRLIRCRLFTLHGSDYSLYLPAGSYINAMDYDSPESLANYLKKFMTDDELYLSYFRWRRKYVVNFAKKDSWCQLCEMLRDPQTKEKMYGIAPWWSGETNNQTCMPKK
jgi:alpha-1,3-fucosyltransferase